MITIIDHFDSFVHTLARYVRECGWAVEIIRQNGDTAAALLARQPDAVIFSPGPGRPENTGISLDILEQAPTTLPMLGVCLGHQLIAHHFGAMIAEHPPCHGRTSPITHNGDALFADLDNPFMAGRYHSLIATDLPDKLVATGWGPEREIMALRHTDRPIWGVQFHPESVLTADGKTIIKNFLAPLGRLGEPL